MMSYLAENAWQAWALVAVLCLILELSVGDFFIICFSLGALCATIVAAFGTSLYVQIGVFVLFTLVCIFLVRPAALLYLHKSDSNRVSNADAIIGRRGRVSATIEAGGYGRVAIDGDDWKAMADSHEEVPVGTHVRVVGRESIIIIVKKES